MHFLERNFIISIKISRVQLTIFQHWFRYWLGTGQATSHSLKQWWLVYWCIYASLGLNEFTEGKLSSPGWRNTPSCVFLFSALSNMPSYRYMYALFKPLFIVSQIIVTMLLVVYVPHHMCPMPQYQWLNLRLQYSQCVSNGVTLVLY